MELCNQYKVHGQNSLLVEGVNEIISDEMIKSFFEQNGKISSFIRVKDEPNQPNGRVLIEFECEKSITRINPDTLGNIPSPSDPTTLWNIRTIRGICQEEIGKDLAQQYLEGLSAIGGSATSGYATILENELKRIRSTASQEPHNTSSLGHSPMQNSSIDVERTSSMTQECNRSQPMSNIHCVPSTHSSVRNSISLEENIINPPSIQRAVVEHVIKNESAHPYSSPIKMRTFSGRLPKPNGEVDYEAWRTQVELLLSDTHVTDSQKNRKILESLIGPAADMVKPLGVNANPVAYVNHLESAFGVVADGEELFAAFLSANQNSGEKPSDYLFRLQTLLTKVISRGGAPLADSEKHLIRQFCRGCWDHSLILGLQLEQKKNSPPSFPELLHQLRTEEDRRSVKLDRMKKHLGSSRASAHAHAVYGIEVPVESKDDDTQKLRDEVAELKKQIATLSIKKEPQPNRTQIEASCMVTNASTPRNFAPRHPKPWFCFKCGEDGHIVAHCVSAPNPVLVHQKNTELRQKREAYRNKHTVTSMPLN